MTKLVRACAASMSVLLLGVTFAASASASNPVRALQESAKTESVRVTGRIQQLVIDNFAHQTTEAHSHEDHAAGAAMITHLVVGEQRIKLDDSNADLGKLTAGATVVLDLAIPASEVPSQAVGTHNQLSRNLAQDLAQDLTSPVPAEIVEVVEQPDLAAAESTTIKHSSVVVLPVPSDYEGELGDCTTAMAECSLPAVPDWSATNGPLSIERATDMMATNEDYWVSQTRGTVEQIEATKIVHVKVPFTADTLCNGNPDDLMEDLWIPLADSYGVGNDNGLTRNSLVAFTGECSSSTDGFAYIGWNGLASSSITQIRNDNDSTLIHEFGHIFSLGHSNLEIVDGPLGPLQSSPIDYYGLYSPMQLTLINSATQRAYTAPALEGAHEIVLGLDRAGEVLEIADSGEYVLTERTGTTGVRTMYINEPNGPSHIIEYRSGTGQDAESFYASTESLPYRGQDLVYTPGVRVYTITMDEHGSNTETYTTSRYDTKASVYLTSFGPGSTVTLFGETRLEVMSLGSGQARIKIDVPEPAPAPVPEKAISALAALDVSGPVKSSIAVPYAIGTSHDSDFTGTIRVLLDEVVLTEEIVTGVAGKAASKVLLPDSLPAGAHAVTLEFVDSPTVKSASASVTVTVEKRSLSSLTLSVPTSTYGSSTKATVTAKGTLAPAGTVKFYVDGKYYKSASIKDGKAAVTLPSTLTAQKHTIKASFPSSSVYNSQTVSSTLTVKKLQGKISGSPTGTKLVRVGSSYSKKVTLNASGKLQRRVDGQWKNVKSLNKGSNTLKFSIGKTTKTQKYRVVVSSTSNVTGVAAQSFVIQPKR